MDQLEKERQAKIEKEDTEKQTKEVAEANKKVHGAINENWIITTEGDRKQLVKTSRINQDIKFLAYHPEDGLKRLVARELGFKVTKEIVIDGIPETVEDAVFDYKGDNLSLLSTEQKRLLDQVYAAQQQAYSEKLFTSYFMAKNKIWKTKGVEKAGEKSPDAINLLPHEWESLGKSFESLLDTGNTGSTNGQQMIENLKSKGIISRGKAESIGDWIKEHPKASWVALILAILAAAVGGTAAIVGVEGLNAARTAIAGFNNG